MTYLKDNPDSLKTIEDKLYAIILPEDKKNNESEIAEEKESKKNKKSKKEEGNV